MINIEALKEISPYLWEIAPTFRSDMRVPARAYLSREMLEALLNEDSLEQLVNIATLPGVEKYTLAMPDIHQGYGFPIGGVAAIRTGDGVISPGGVGYDINCGVRLLTSSFHTSEIKEHLEKIATQMQRDVPSGVGRGGEFVLNEKEFNHVLNSGVRWALERGLASEEDIAAIEEYGHYQQAESSSVPEKAKKRGHDQLGTIGSGNHFVEVQEVVKIFNAEAAQDFGLFDGQVCVMIHTGSRGLGHETCTEYVRLMNKVMPRYDITLPDRELACAPFRSSEGQQYFRAMAAAANFAWTNRQVITHQIRKAWRNILKTGESENLKVLYDVSHNIAKLEQYSGREFLVHRKGATRAFGPGSPNLAERFKKSGQPVLIPGSMGTYSYVLAGTEGAMQNSFGSACHGAGRRLSRTKARKTIDIQNLRKDLESYGVVVRAGSASGLLEEAPQAYKNVNEVVEVVERGGLANIVAKLKPLAVIKG